MSMIHCTSPCIYQKEGYCRLEKAAKITAIPNENNCLHYKAKEIKNAGASDSTKT